MVVRKPIRSTATEKTTTLVAGRPIGAYGRLRFRRPATGRKLPAVPGGTAHSWFRGPAWCRHWFIGVGGAVDRRGLARFSRLTFPRRTSSENSQC